MSAYEPINRIKHGVRAILCLPAINPIARSVVQQLRPMLPDKLVVRMPVTTPIRCELEGIDPFLIASDVRDPLVRMVFWNGVGYYEPFETQVFVAALQECSIVFDIGAYIGWYTLIALSLPQIKTVYGFEPQPEVFKLYQHNITLNKFTNVHIFQKAVTDELGVVDFHVPSGKNSISSEASLNPAFRLGTRVMPVEAITLDVLVEQQHINQVDFIKIDVESAEVMVLRGATKVLESYAPLIMLEVLPGTAVHLLNDLLRDREYRYFKIGAFGLREDNQIKADTEYHNWLLIPKGKLNESLIDLIQL